MSEATSGNVRQRRAGTKLVAAATLALALAACSERAVLYEPPAATGPTQPRVTSTDTTEVVVDPEDVDAAVLAAYRHNWDVINTAFAEQNVIGLHRVATGPLLWGVTDEILYDIRYSMVIDGRIIVHPRIESVRGQQAVVVDCWISEDQVRDTRTGEVLGDYRQTRELRVELTFDDDTWKLFDFTVVADSCEPPAPVI